MFQPSTRHLKAALAGVLFAWLCLLQGAYGLANLGPEIRDPANFLPPRILVGADMTTSIKPSRPQTLDRQATASGIPDWLSREPLGENESLNLYSYCHNDPVNNVDRLGLESVPMYQNQIAQAMAQLGWAPGEYERKSSAIDAQWAQWMEMFAGLEALAQKGDPKALHQLRLLRDVHQGSHEMNGIWLDSTMRGSQATIDVASAGINRIYKQTAFLEWVSGRESGSLDPTGDPGYFDDDNPEFQGDEWSRRFIQFSPGGTIARHTVNGQYGAASYEFGKEVAIWSTMGIAGEFVGTGRVAFGVTRGGMGGGVPSSLWRSGPPGIQVRQYGGWWAKRANPNSNTLMQWWGQQTINAQSKGLQQLGDMATQNSMRNGILFTKDVGAVLPDGYRLLNPISRKAYLQGSRRMGTFFNDIQPRNMGVNGLIFDPAIDPVSKGLFWGGLGTAGYGAYELAD